MGLVGDQNINLGEQGDSKESRRSWWERQKRRAKERTVSLALKVPEVVVYAWIVLGVLDFSVYTFLAVYFSGFLVSLYSFSFLFEKENPLPGWAKYLAQKIDMMDWFVFEYQVFTTRILLIAFVVSCVSALAFVGVGEELAVIVSLALIALTMPTYLVYYVMSKKDEGGEKY